MSDYTRREFLRQSLFNWLNWIQWYQQLCH